MNFSRLKQAQDYEVENWLKENLELTVYGKQQLINEELIRFCPYKFYKRREVKKHNFLWRLTAPVYLVYVLLMMLAMPIKWLITGNRYLPQKFLDKFHYRWEEKMGW